eukprot:g25966.t1
MSAMRIGTFLSSPHLCDSKVLRAFGLVPVFCRHLDQIRRSAIDWGYRPHSDAERAAAFVKTSLCSAVLDVFVPSTAAGALSHKLAGRHDQKACFRLNRRSCPCHLTHQLVPAVVDLIIACISKSSRVTYMKCIRHSWIFLTFFNLQHYTILVSPDLLLFFITWLFLAVPGRGTAIDGSSTGACASFYNLGFSIQAFNDPRVARMKRAVKHLRTRATRARLPVTVLLVARLLYTLPSISALGPDSIMIAAVLCVGVYGLLRSGEIVSKSESASAPLLRVHVAWDAATSPLWIYLFIPASKTDYMRTGSYVRLWKNNPETCPFSKLLAAWDAATDRFPTTPLFQDTKCKALSYKWLQKVLRSLVKAVGLDPSFYSSHSLRIGSATSLEIADVRRRDKAHQQVMFSVIPTVRYALERLVASGHRVCKDEIRSFSAGGVLGGGLSISQALRWSSDDVDYIASRFS